MKKVISASLLLLVASMMVSGMPMAAEAQTDLTILVQIALKAQSEVKQQISSSSSDEIKELFKEASNEVVQLEESLERDDESSAKQHFLNAMRMFKNITHMISSDSPTQELQAADVATSVQKDYTYELERIKKFISSLKSIAGSQSVNFEAVDGLVIQAENQIREHDGEIEVTIQQLKDVLQDIQKELRNYASQTTDNKTVTFFQTMIDRLEDRNVDPESLQKAQDLLEQYKQLIADGNDEAEIVKNELTQLIRELYHASA